MVDFKELRRRSYERASPEERARIDAYHAREARFDETKSTIKAVFERSYLRPVKKPADMKNLRLLNKRPSRYGERRTAQSEEMETVVDKTWEVEIPVRIEEIDVGNGRVREVISFKEAVTGYETFTLDEEFVRIMLDPDENRQRPRFYICGGTPGRYDSCYVMPADVLEYLRERRPHLFPDHGQDAACPR